MREERQRQRGLVLRLNRFGTYAETVFDGLGLAVEPEPGDAFADLVNEGSRSKARSFLDFVHSHKAAFRWEMNVPLAEGVFTLVFAGVEVDDSILVAAALSEQDILQLYEGVVCISNEQANMLRRVMKDSTGVLGDGERAQDQFDEISRLNNELINAQRELARRNQELARLNEQKNMFLGMAAHDLRNPLGNILNLSEFLTQDLEKKLGETQAAMLDMIGSSSRFMLRLIEDLLDYSRIESGRLDLQLEPLDLAQALKDHLEMVRAMASRKSMTIDFRKSGSVLPAMADLNKIVQVLDNLLTNAVKFSPEGAKVKIDMWGEEERVFFRVSDQGPGMKEEDLEKLYRPFERKSAQPTGGEKSTGLGLAIVKRIVTGHGGEISVENRPEGGAAFTVSLPAAPSASGG